MTEQERAERYVGGFGFKVLWSRMFYFDLFRKKKFIEENQTKIKNFGMLKHYDDSKKYLTENSNLVCEDTANYLVVWCIDLEIEEVCKASDLNRSIERLISFLL